MGKFNWIMLSLAGTLGAAALLSMALFLALDIKVWLTRARRLRHSSTDISASTSAAISAASASWPENAPAISARS